MTRSARLSAALSGLAVLLMSHFTYASCVERECRITPTLATCEGVDDETWPGDQLFSFTGQCVMVCRSEDSDSVTLQELTLDTIEVIDVSGREPRRVSGPFVELDRSCEGDPLFRFERRLTPGNRYLVRWNHRQMGYFVVTRPAEGESVDVPLEPSPAPRQEPPTRLGERRPNWDRNRNGLGWTVSASGSLYLTAPPENDLVILLGGTISFGLRHLREFNPNGLLERSDRLAGLAPLLSLVLPAVFLLPVGSIIGNDVGVDLTINIHAPVNPQEPGLWIAVGLRPYFRVSRDSMIHTGSTLELFIPEVGFEWVGEQLESFYAIWTVFPVAFRFREHFALGIDPVRAGISVDLEDGTVISRFQLLLSAQFL